MSKFDISAKVNPLKDQSGNVKAMASISIDNVIAINDLTIVEGQNGLFIGFPKNKDGQGNYRDIVDFHIGENGKMTQDGVDLKDAISKILIDMYNKGERSTPEKASQEKLSASYEVKAFVTPLRDSQNATKGLATVQIGELFKINSIRVNENTKEGADNFGKNFVAMPSRPDKTAEGDYKDIVHPISKDFADKLKSTVLKQYDNQLKWKNRTANNAQEAQQHAKPAANKSAQGID